MFCARLFICALWSPAGKGLTSWLSFVVSSVSLSLSHWYPWSGVVLDCIDSWSLHHYLLLINYIFDGQKCDLGVDNFRYNLNKLLSIASLWNHCWKDTILTSSIDIYCNLYKLCPWLINVTSNCHNYRSTHGGLKVASGLSLIRIKMKLFYPNHCWGAIFC